MVALPKPLATPHMPMVTASETDSMIEMAGERGYTLLSAFLEAAPNLRVKGEKYARAALAAGRPSPLKNIAASRIVYIADSERRAIEDLRPAITHEIGLQAERGFLKMLAKVFDLVVPNDETAIDALVESGFYILGEPDYVANRLKDFFEESGGFGTLLIVTGKDWATRDKRDRSMRLFMEHVAPQLRHLEPTDPAPA